MKRRPRGPDGRLLPTTGRTITAKGYVRITRGRYRHWYAHRAVMDEATQEFCYYGAGIPEGFHVHHINFDKRHNCRCNLMLLDEALHNGHGNAMEEHRDERGRYVPRMSREEITDDMPAWVTEDEYAA